MRKWCISSRRAQFGTFFYLTQEEEGGKNDEILRWSLTLAIAHQQKKIKEKHESEQLLSLLFYKTINLSLSKVDFLQKLIY